MTLWPSVHGAEVDHTLLDNPISIVSDSSAELSQDLGW